MKPHIAQTLDDLRTEQVKLQSMIDVIEAYGRATADAVGTTEGSDAPAVANPPPTISAPKPRKHPAASKRSSRLPPSRVGCLASVLRDVWLKKPGWEFAVNDLVVTLRREQPDLVRNSPDGLPSRISVACIQSVSRGHLIRLSKGCGARFRVPQTPAQQYEDFKKTVPIPATPE